MGGGVLSIKSFTFLQFIDGIIVYCKCKQNNFKRCVGGVQSFYRGSNCLFLLKSLALAIFLERILTS